MDVGNANCLSWWASWGLAAWMALVMLWAAAITLAVLRHLNSCRQSPVEEGHD